MRGVLQDIHVTAYSPLGSPDSATMMKRPDDTPSLLVRCAFCYKALANVATLSCGVGAATVDTFSLPSV